MFDWYDDWGAAMGDARRSYDYLLDNSDDFLDILTEECRTRGLISLPIGILQVSNVGIDRQGQLQSHVFGRVAFDDGETQDFQIIFWVDAGKPPQPHHIVVL